MLAAVLNPSALEVSHLEMVFRLACALFVGAVIGTEREYTHRPAGMRTHILVSVGSCVVMLTSQVIFSKYLPFGITADPARLSAQVISGVGFLGAGTIMREGLTVKGLTTAASLWTVACLGIAAGGGFYDVALLGMVFAMLALTIFEWLQRRLPGNGSVSDVFTVDCADIGVAMDKINNCADTYHASLSGYKILATETGFSICFRGEFHGKNAHKRMRRFIAAMCDTPGVRSVENQH
jgi:putative Mg2+ transporter-C (MgtC) family protein